MQIKSQAAYFECPGCRYVALEGRRALHMKGTLVRQAAQSSYKLTEARLGGRLTRQDLFIEQVHVHALHLCACMTLQPCAMQKS